MSKSHVVNPFPIAISEGTPVVPLAVGQKSNGIITEVMRDYVIVVTDFGNEIKYTHQELRSEYGEPVWAAEHRMYYGTNDSYKAALRERWETQLQLIQTQLEKLDG